MDENFNNMAEYSLAQAFHTFYVRLWAVHFSSAIRTLYSLSTLLFFFWILHPIAYALRVSFPLELGRYGKQVGKWIGSTVYNCRAISRPACCTTRMDGHQQDSMCENLWCRHDVLLNLSRRQSLYYFPHFVVCRGFSVVPDGATHNWKFSLVMILPLSVQIPHSGHTGCLWPAFV
ncbi:hypothetical protein GGS21DRAFT_471193 [Xylaria nigripes]|nr:hypothetical protein GGS21DRAFT_471193 [Xylaria nigripes]